MHEERVITALRWVRVSPLEEEKHSTPNLQSIYREAILYLKKRDWEKAEHLAKKAIGKLEAGGRKDLADRVKKQLQVRMERDAPYGLVAMMSLTGGC